MTRYQPLQALNLCRTIFDERLLRGYLTNHMGVPAEKIQNDSPETLVTRISANGLESWNKYLRILSPILFGGLWQSFDGISPMLLLECAKSIFTSRRLRRWLGLLDTLPNLTKDELVSKMNHKNWGSYLVFCFEMFFLQLFSNPVEPIRAKLV